MIKKIPYSKIDIQKYQSCLTRSEQYHFFAEKCYLDALIAERWEVLVLDDYQAVMPVPVERKWGISFVVMPMQTQQLGVFSEKDSAEVNVQFKDFLEQHYNVLYYAFNAKNMFETKSNWRRNYVLVRDSYAEIRKNYSVHRRRNVRITEALQDHIRFSERKNLAAAEDFFSQHIAGGEDKNTARFFSNMQKLKSESLLRVYDLFYDQSLISQAYVVSSPKMNFLVNFINDKAFLKINSSSILIDQLLQISIEDQDFNFHGSTIPAIADFYKRFGAEEEGYHYVENSKFTLFLNIIKRIF